MTYWVSGILYFVFDVLYFVFCILYFVFCILYCVFCISAETGISVCSRRCLRRRRGLGLQRRDCQWVKFVFWGGDEYLYLYKFLITKIGIFKWKYHVCFKANMTWMTQMGQMLMMTTLQVWLWSASPVLALAIPSVSTNVSWCVKLAYILQ